MSNMFFRLDSGLIVNLEYVKVIDQGHLWFHYDGADFIRITPEEYKRIVSFLKDQWMQDNAPFGGCNNE